MVRKSETAPTKKNSRVNSDRLAPPNRGPHPTAPAKVFSVAARESPQKKKNGSRPTEPAFY